MAKNREEFWDRLEDIRTGMLNIGGRFIPITLNTEPEDGKIWFLTARGTDPAKAAEAGEATHLVVANDGEGIYADIHGKLSVSQDRDVLDEVWSPMAKIWFDKGKDDPDLVLMCLTPDNAEVWLGPESGLEGIISLVKARFGGDVDELGEHFTLDFGGDGTLVRS